MVLPKQQLTGKKKAYTSSKHKHVYSPSILAVRVLCDTKKVIEWVGIGEEKRRRAPFMCAALLNPIHTEFRIKRLGIQNFEFEIAPTDTCELWLIEWKGNEWNESFWQSSVSRRKKWDTYTMANYGTHFESKLTLFLFAYIFFFNLYSILYALSLEASKYSHQRHMNLFRSNETILCDTESKKKKALDTVV